MSAVPHTTVRLTVVAIGGVLAITALVVLVCSAPRTIHSFGNQRTEAVCTRYGQPKFC
jgi:hypothetical protein